MVEEWEKWEPVKSIPSRLYVDRVVEDINGFLIEMTSEDEKVAVNVCFAHSVMAYRNSDEGKRIKTIHFLSQAYGKGFLDGLCYKVNNSSFLNWFTKESCGGYSPIEIEHYSFLADNAVIDVLSDYPPEISVFDNIVTSD